MIPARSERRDLAETVRDILSRTRTPGEEVRLACRLTVGDWARVLAAAPVAVHYYARIMAVVVEVRRGGLPSDAKMPDEPLALLAARLAGAKVNAQREQLRADDLERRLAERGAGR